MIIQKHNCFDQKVARATKGMVVGGRWISTSSRQGGSLDGWTVNFVQFKAGAGAGEGAGAGAGTGVGTGTGAGA